MSIESIVKTLNKQAMELLGLDKCPESFKLLKKAEEIIRTSPISKNSKLKAITLNNLGCYYKHINSNEIALDYLYRSLEEEQNLDLSITAGIHLNILSILSSKNKHKDALFHGIKALNILKKQENKRIFIFTLQYVADEYLALGKISNSLKVYKYALDLSEKLFGKRDDLTISLQDKYLKACKPQRKYFFERFENFEDLNQQKLEKLKKIKKFNSPETFKYIQNFSIFPDTKKPNFPNKSTIKIRNIDIEKSGKKFKSERLFKNKSSQDSNKSRDARSKTTFKKGKIYKLNDSYLNLEKKVNFLQNKLENFEIRYERLENLARVKLDKISGQLINKDQSALLIQKTWRGFRARKIVQLMRARLEFSI